jgi:hypothetical protein
MRHQIKKEERISNAMTSGLTFGRAVLAHSSYSVQDQRLRLDVHNLRQEFLNNILSNPPGSLARYQYWAIDEQLPFKLIRWIGDLPDMSELIDQEKKEKKPYLVVINSVLSTEFKNKWAGKVYELSAPWLSNYYSTDQILTEFENLSVEKDFACPINRLDPNRQSWFYLLIQKNMLDRGFVSFNLDNSRSQESIQNLTPYQAFEKLYQDYMLNFSEEHKIAKKIVPYRNFPADENLDAVIMKSRFNIILETYFSFNDQIMMTEKTIRSLRLPRPWLLYGAAGSVAQLRKWGFDILDDLVDHRSYDTIEHPIERQTKILEIAQQLLEFDTVKHWQRLKTAAFVNNEVLVRWKNAFSQAVFDDFYQILDDYAMRNNLSAK